MTSAVNICVNTPPRFIALAFVVATVAGCGRDELRRVVVTGQVTYGGQPIPNGQVVFYPAGETPGPATAATITAGKYIADAKGGVPSGKHRVMIEAYRPPTARPGINIEDLGREQYIPAKYNTQSEITTELNEAESPAQRDFALDASS
jgi:hypothetical protein